MYKLVLLLVVVVLTGCATGPKVPTPTQQICDLKTVTEVVLGNHGQIISEHTVQKMVCNDNQIQRLFQSQSGMAPNCGEFTYWMNMGGRNVKRKGISCQKPNGSWEIVNTSQW